jgi:hypothetical protein
VLTRLVYLFTVRVFGWLVLLSRDDVWGSQNSAICSDLGFFGGSLAFADKAAKDGPALDPLLRKVRDRVMPGPGTDQVPAVRSAITQIHRHVADLLCRPPPVRVRRHGAGGIFRALRIWRTVDALTRWPTLSSSPWILL